MWQWEIYADAFRDILGAFLFSGEDVEKKVRVLSGGERSRLAMARMLLQPFNLLILDEPTNHLDMRSKDILKNALLAFDGTLIVVSHDREFLDGLVDKVFEFRHQKVKEHLGGIYEFLQRRKIGSLKDIERKDQVQPGVVKADAESRKQEKGGQKQSQVREEKAAGSDHKLHYEERKALEKKIRKISNRVKALEREVEEIESALGRMNALLMNPENISGMQVYEEYEQLKKRHDEALASWEKHTLQLEKAEARRK